MQLLKLKNKQKMPLGLEQALKAPWRLDPDRRRCGLGRSLLNALLQRARMQGARQATLEVASDNEAAVGLYDSHGFQIAGCRRNYYRDGRDALIQWCRLTHPR